MEPQVVDKLESLEGAGVVNGSAALEEHLKRYELNPITPAEIAPQGAISN